MMTSVPFLKLYTDYVTNLNAASQLVESWVEKNKRFAALVKDIKDNPKYGRLTLQAHMLEPIQRVPRYELLLREYLKKMPENSEDRPNVMKSLEVVADVASHFESMLQRDARMSELIQIQKQLLGFGLNVISHDRHLVRRGHVMTVNVGGKRSEKYAFLFNDMLLVCIERPVMAKFQVKHQLMLKQAKVTAGSNLANTNTFVVRYHNKSVELAFSSVEEKNLWEQDVLNQLKLLAKKKLQLELENEPEVRLTVYAAYGIGHVMPFMVPKESVTNCRQCERIFAKETQQHYCRACGNVFCRKCASQVAMLDYERQMPLRVCDACFAHLNDDSSGSPCSDVSLPSPQQLTQITYRNDIVEQDYLQISADGGATWVLRWFVFFETGLLSSYKTDQDEVPLAWINLETKSYVVRLVSVDLPQNLAINVASKEKSYLFHTDQQSTVERWYEALCRVRYQRISRPTLV